MTWGEFKKHVDQLVTDDRKVEWIDWSSDIWGDAISVQLTEDNKFYVVNYDG